MNPTLRNTLGILALVALLVVPAACDSEASNLLPDQDKYDFTTTCEAESELQACSDCCTGLSFDTALVALGDCGCSYQYVDWDICEASDGDFDACASCCEASDDGAVTNLRNGECRCLGIQKTQPSEDRRPNKCENSGDTCRCSRDTNGTCEPIGIPGDSSIVCTCSL